MSSGNATLDLVRRFGIIGIMRQKSWKFWTATGLATVLVLLLGSALAYSFYYADRGLPNVSLAGEPITGMTKDEATQLTAERAEAVHVAVTLDGQTTEVPLAQLGYTVDTQKMVDSAFAGNASIFHRFNALFSPVDVQAQVTYDAAEQEKFTHQLVEEVGTPPSKGSVALDPAANTYVVSPGESGTSLDTEALHTAAEQAAETLVSQPVTLEIEQVDPLISTAQAEQVAVAANRIVETTVELTTTLNVYSPDQAEKASWVKIPEVFQDGAALTGEADETIETAVTIDPARVKEWVQTTTEASNDEPVPGLRNINSRGDIVQVVTEGESGWVANNTEALTEGLISALNAGDSFSQQIKYDEIENKEWEEQLIADGAENLAYQAAKGEKWIDINLSNYTTTAYEGATVVRGPVFMVPGAPGLETVTGKYAVWAKVANQTMRGDNLDGTKYETPDVPWILYFHGGYALHGAYWRSSFGYGGPAGSHGCVNMPVGEAKWFYDWASVGTPVVSHY